MVETPESQCFFVAASERSANLRRRISNVRLEECLSFQQQFLGGGGLGGGEGEEVEAGGEVGSGEGVAAGGKLAGHDHFALRAAEGEGVGAFG